MMPIILGIGISIVLFALTLVIASAMTVPSGYCSPEPPPRKVKAASSRRTPKPAALARLANEARGLAMIGLANEIGDENAQWIQITPKGDYPHEKGIQRIDDVAITTLANSFNSIAAKMARRFGGAPIFIGHPDNEQFANEYKDKKAYGWIKEVEPRADGLYGRVEWSPPGKELIQNKHYRFHSPHWEGKELGMEKGRMVYRPVVLLSAGLTNTPQLPVQALANEKKENHMERSLLIAALGLAATATDADITATIGALKSDAGKVSTLANEKKTLGEEKTTAETKLANEQTALANEKAKHAETKTALTNVAAQRNKLVLANAIRLGKITPAEEAAWALKLTENWETNSAALEAKTKAIKTESRLGGAGSRRVTLSNEEDIKIRRAKTAKLVNEKMTGGMSYDDAFNAVKLENAALFDEMMTPESED